MDSPAFERFYRSFTDNSHDVLRSGLAIDALVALEGEERAKAEDLLLTRLRAGDTRAAVGLGALRSQRALPLLERMFAAERGYADGPRAGRLAEVAHALWRVRPDRRWLDAEIDVLERSTERMNRRAAAEALADFHAPEASDALSRALDSPEKLVRATAARSLLDLHGVTYDTNDNSHPMYRVMSPDVVKREAAKQEILASIAGRPIAPP